MRPTLLRLLLLVALLPTALAAAAPREHVILLHGMVRSDRSMEPLAEALRTAGYAVSNLNYPSRTAEVEPLGDAAIGAALAACRSAGATRIHFVTHSLGGILVRSYLARHAVPELGRLVLLGPPNHGSEVVDALGSWVVFGWLNGPAGRQLGTDAGSAPNRLGAAPPGTGIIAGDRSINWINSLIIPGPDDGKVSVVSTRLAGAADHLVLHVTHPFMMRNPEVIRQTLHFLREGKFDRGQPAGTAAPGW